MRQETIPALAAAFAVLEAHGYADHWRPKDGALGQEIKAIVAEAVEAAEEGEPPRFEDIAQWGEDYGPDMLNAMIAALEAARRFYTERAKTLAQAIAIARIGGDPSAETALDLLTPETRRALVRRLGYGPALKLCEDEKRAALATTRAMKTGEPSRLFATCCKTAPPLRRRKRGRKG